MRTDRQKMVMSIQAIAQLQSEVSNDLGRGLTDTARVKNEWLAKGYYASEINRAIREAIAEFAKSQKGNN